MKCPKCRREMKTVVYPKGRYYECTNAECLYSIGKPDETNEEKGNEEES